MEAVREPEVIQLYREDEVVELVANYLWQIRSMSKRDSVNRK